MAEIENLHHHEEKEKIMAISLTIIYLKVVK